MEKVHRLAGGHRCVELLAKADDVHVMFGEQCPEVYEILQAPGDPIKLEANDEVDLSGGNVAFEPLQLGPVLILGAFTGVNVELKRSDLQVLPPLAEFHFLLDFVLLGKERVPLVDLALR